MEQNLIKLLKKIIIPKYQLICPTCHKWIGMSEQEVKEHLDKFRDVIKLNAEILKKKDKGGNGC